MTRSTCAVDAAEIAATLGILEADLETIKAQAAWLRDRAIEIGKELVEQGDSRGTYEARLELMELHQRAAALVDLRPAHPFLATIAEHHRERKAAERQG